MVILTFETWPDKPLSEIQPGPNFRQTRLLVAADRDETMKTMPIIAKREKLLPQSGRLVAINARTGTTDCASCVEA